MKDFTTQAQVDTAYARLARRYDRAACLLELVGIGYDRLRRDAVAALEARPGDTVVEIGCGTGLNFPLLEAAVGPKGRIIGVDPSPAMLAQAEQRIAEAGWTNIVLVRSTASDYVFPADGVDRVLSTCALTLEPEYDRVIAAIAAALRPHGRFVTADLKLARGWPLVFLPFLLALTRPFAVSLKLARRHPWESMQRHMADFRMTERFGGYLYLASAGPRVGR